MERYSDISDSELATSVVFITEDSLPDNVNFEKIIGKIVALANKYGGKLEERTESKLKFIVPTSRVVALVQQLRNSYQIDPAVGSLTRAGHTA